MQGLVLRDRGRVPGAGLLADGEADAARAQGDGLAFRPGSRADRDLDPIPGLLRSAQTQHLGEDVGSFRERLDHRLRESGQQAPVAGNEPHRGPAVEPDDPEPAATRSGFQRSGQRAFRTLDAHDEFSRCPHRMSYRAFGVTAIGGARSL